MKRAALALLITLAVPAVALSAPSEKKEEKKDEKKESTYDPENITALSQYMDNVVKGSEKYKKGEHAQAVDLFKKAVALAPKNALAHLLLGETYLAMNNLPEAEAAFLAAQEASTSDVGAKSPLLRSHVLFAVADVYEREKKWNEAKSAWQAYVDHCAKLSADAGAHPATGTARRDLVDKVLEREKVYAAVRERIAAEKSDAGAGAKADAATPKK